LHRVKCYYCGATFDRDQEAYAQVNSRRYAHASCALRECEKNKELPKPKIVDPTDFVNCIYCKQTFNKSEEDFKLFSNGKYAHAKCFELEQTRELTDQEKLERYIMQLFGADYVYAKIKKQIKDYVTNHGYTYSGIHKALIYYYEVKGNKFDAGKSQGGIGIVPYVYNSAYNYYYAIWEAQQKQEHILDASSLDEYIPKVIEVHIPTPKRQERKRNLFGFLDEEEKENLNGK
jgi:hypothetical protein